MSPSYGLLGVENIKRWAEADLMNLNFYQYQTVCYQKKYNQASAEPVSNIKRVSSLEGYLG